MLVRFSLLETDWIPFFCQKSTASSHRSRCQSARRATCHLATTWSTSRCSPPRTNQRCSAVRTSSPTASLLLCPPPPYHPPLLLQLTSLTPPTQPQKTDCLCVAWTGDRVTPPLLSTSPPTPGKDIPVTKWRDPPPPVVLQAFHITLDFMSCADVTQMS